MGTIATKQSTGEKKQQEAFRRFKKGMTDGHEWVVASDYFDAQEFVSNVGWEIPYPLRTPWAKCPFPDLRKTLRSQGHAYTIGFIRAVQDTFKADYSAVVFKRHQVGVEDGKRWSFKYANDGQQTRISEFARVYKSREIFISPHFCGSWTPAHRLIVFLMGDDAYPIDENGEYLVDCTEFRDFWQPFVTEPMDRVMSNLKLYGFRAGHKLQDSNYIAGFVDGALGLSEHLERRMSERMLTPPLNAGDIRGK